MSDQPKILIVEDDQDLAASIQTFIQDFADTEIANDGDTGAFVASQGVADAIILDIMLPGMNGWDLLHQLRQQHVDTPVLILTAKDGMEDKLRGFDLGADDYLTKPFHREELIARLKAILKRTGRYFDADLLSVANLTIDLKQRTVTANQQDVDLNGKEFDLLVYLAENQNTILTKAQIFDRLWGFDSETALTVVEVYMSNLRKKLKPVQAADLIRTIRNVGYILQVEDTK